MSGPGLGPPRKEVYAAPSPGTISNHIAADQRTQPRPCHGAPSGSADHPVPPGRAKPAALAYGLLKALCRR